MKSKNEIKCDVCSLAFQTEGKYQTHICRVHVKNPECGDYYTRSKFTVNGCTLIFSKSKEREVLYLHSEQCLTNINRCSDIYSGYHMTNYDGETYHAPLNDFFHEGMIRWEALDGDYDIRIRWKHIHIPNTE